MGISRRDVLVQGGVIGAGLLATDLPGWKAIAWAVGEPQRKSLAGLAWNDPIVATYRDAVGIMKQTGSGDALSWAAVGNTHLNFCPHGNWYFLPWHRAFVVSIERIVRSLTKNNDFAMPYWDWTADPYFPEVFRSEKTPDSKTNWLYVPDNKRTWDMAVPFPPNVVGKDVLDAILTAAPYETFGTTRPQSPKPQDSLDPGWIRNGSGFQGILEGLPHNMVHNDIGGWMPTMYSPLDPIFFTHHGNIDRIWAVWNSKGNANSTEKNWTDMPFTDNFTNPDKSKWSPKVSELFDPVALGYTYGLSAEPVEAASPRLISLNSKLTSLFALPSTRHIAGVRRVSAHALHAHPSARVRLSARVDTGLLGAVAHRRRNPAPGASVRERQEAQALGPRVYVLLRDVTVTAPLDGEYRVFIPGNGIGPDTPTSDPHYVGMFSVFHDGAMGEHATHQGNPSFLLDLTDAVVRVYGSVSKMPKNLELDVFAVPDQKGVDPGSVAVGSFEIVFVAP